MGYLIGFGFIWLALGATHAFVISRATEAPDNPMRFVPRRLREMHALVAALLLAPVVAGCCVVIVYTASHAGTH